MSRLRRIAGLTGAIVLLGAAPAQGQSPSLIRQAMGASAAHEWTEAARLWTEVVTQNPAHPGHWTRLAEALSRSGEHTAALAAYDRERRLGARHVADISFDVARTYGRLGRRAETVTWLARAYEDGLRHYNTARRDSAFAFIREDPEYRALVGLIDRDTLTRDAGWRYDIAFYYRALRQIHYDLFATHSRDTFERVVADLVAQVPSLTDDGIVVRLMALSRMAGDAHTNMYPDYVFRSAREGVPVTFWAMDEGVYVATAAPAHADLTGAEVVTVGGRPVAAVVDSVSRIVSHDNTQWLRLWAPHLLAFPQILHGLGLGARRDSLALTLRLTDGRSRAVQLPVQTGPPGEDWTSLWTPAGETPPLYRRHPDRLLWFEHLPALDAVYAKIDRIFGAGGESFEEFVHRLFGTVDSLGVRRLILDLRDNVGGNLTLTDPLVHALARRPRLAARGNLYVIIGRRTFSAAQITAARLDRHFAPIFVGEPTGSRPNFVGETVYITLPWSGLEPSISNMAWQGTVAFDYRTWIAPDLYAPPTLEAARHAVDPAMTAIEAALRPED